VARKRKPTNALPSREQIKNFIEESPGPVGRREIARAFNVKGAARVDLKKLLGGLIKDGAIDPGQRRRVAAPGRLPAVGVIEVVSIGDDAEAIAKPVSGVKDGADAKILLPHTGRGPSFAVGDRVLARLAHVRDDLYRGSVMRRLEKGASRIVGVLESARGGFRLAPSDGKKSNDAQVEQINANGARAGDIVAVELLPGQRLGPRRARVVETIGRHDSPKAVSLICIHEHDIPDRFPESAVEQAEAARPATVEGKRQDLRDIPLITIDGADARDFDDAVWAEADTSVANHGGWRLLVAIADVAHYVRSGDALDKEAQKRGNSVYFSDRVVPMLPEALSNGLCSLRPDEDRACLAVEMIIDAKGRKKSHQFLRGLMRSVARVTYEEIQAVVDAADPGDATGDASEGVPGVAADAEPRLTALAQPLYGAFRSLLGARETRGALDIEMPDMQVILNDDGQVTAITPRQRLDSHRLIEEFMVLANVAAAETLERRKRACVYRVHDVPNPDKVEEMRNNLEGFGIKFAKGQVLQAKLFNRVLAQAKDQDFQHSVNLLVLRSQSQAVYSPFNLGHFGLGLSRYAHFTSPIRRYSDLLVHRALIDAHDFGPDGDRRTEADDLVTVCEHISMTERRASVAERSATDRFSAMFMANRVGEDLDAVISGVVYFGVFVTLGGGQADALLPVSSLPDDYYDHDPKTHALTGRHSGFSLKLGQSLTVKLREADPVTGRIRVDYVDGSTQNRPSRGPRKPSPGRQQSRPRGRRR
jgi:ribonuclease R